MKTCPNCATESDNKFCPECGADLSTVQDVMVCPNCATKSTTKFCPECGTNLSEPPSSVNVLNAMAQNDDEYVSESIPEAVVEAPERIQPNDSFGQKTNTEEPVQGVATQVIKAKKSKKKLFIIIGAVLLLLIIIMAAAGGGDEETSTTETTETEATYEEETTTEPTTTEPTTVAPVDKFTKEEDYESIEYDKLARNPDDHEGKMIKGSGKVIQVMDGENEVDLRIATSSDGYDDVVLAYYDPSIVDSRILEDDQVTYYGESLGLYTYESTMGGEITIPLVEIHKITRD